MRTMLSSFVTLALTVFVSHARSSSIDSREIAPDINIAPIVGVEVSTKVKIDSSLYNGSTSLVDSFRVYLAMAAAESRRSSNVASWYPQCKYYLFLFLVANMADLAPDNIRSQRCMK
jgi:hypothetical protein